MKKIAIAAATMGAFVALAPLQAQDAKEPEATIERASAKSEAGDENTERDDEAVVCRSLAPKVGTRIPGRRVCLPLYQWAEWDNTTRETAQDVEMRGRLYGR